MCIYGCVCVCIGLRTLCIAKAEISEDFYDEWKHTFYKASTSIQNREKKLEEAAELIERVRPFSFVVLFFVSFCCCCFVLFYFFHSSTFHFMIHLIFYNNKKEVHVIRYGCSSLLNSRTVSGHHTLGL